MNFEEGTKKLEEIVKKLDSNEISLEESITLFEEGVKISKECMDILNKSKGKITVIKEEFDKVFETPIE